MNDVEKKDLAKVFEGLIYGYFSVGKTEDETVELLTEVFEKEKGLPAKTVSECIRKAHQELTLKHQV
ncbi:MAG: hypothetical protein ACKKL6_00265 [Candidatus Komeilibacteria bacterium]